VSVVLHADQTLTPPLQQALRTLVRRQVGAYAVPRTSCRAAPAKTRSGKIMRRVVRAEYLGLPVGDVSGQENE